MIKIQYDSEKFNSMIKRLDELGNVLGREALVKSINDATRETQQKIIRDMPKDIDRPKKITLNSLYANFANKSRLDASIEFKGYAGKKFYSTHWLSPIVFGGARKDKGLDAALRHFGFIPSGYQAVPTKDIKTDGYGNVPGSYVVSMLSYLRIDMSKTQNKPYAPLTKRQHTREARRKSKFFVVRIGEKSNLSPGIYEYKTTFGGRGVRKVYDFLQVKYKPLFPFFEKASTFARDLLFKRFNDRFDDLTKNLRG